MNTLQLYISKSARERVKLAEINPTEQGRKAAADMKSAVALVDYAPSAKMVFYIVVNTADGYAIHIIRTIPPTRPNHLDATIFIDKKLNIMAEDLAEVLDKVTSIVLAKAVSETDMNQLRHLFDREYDLRDKDPRIKPSRGNDYACLSYGPDSGRSLDQLLDDGIYRKEWSAYKGVIILDDTVTPVPNSVVDLDNIDEPEQEDDCQPSDTAAPDTAAQAAPARTYVFSLPVITPEGRSTLEFELESAKPITASPVKGYETSSRIVAGQDHTNMLRRSSGKTTYERMERWIWGAAGLVAGLMIMWIASLFSDEPQRVNDSYIAEEQQAPVAQQPETPASTPTTAPSQTKAQKPQPTEATAYLDNNRTWKRDDMENIEDLRGLFDDLNNYRFDQITGKWAEKLKASKNFSKVVKAADKAVSKKVDPRRGEGNDHKPKYNREGDTNISWLGYTYWIDP